MKKTLRITVYIFILLTGAYLLLWFQSRRVYPVVYGISFSNRQAEWLGFHWKNVYRDMLSDLKPQYVRLSAFWDTIEPQKGKYDFADLDHMMNEAKKNNVKVTLVIGQKMPRWPECYIPKWATDLPAEKMEKELMSYVETVVNRYKTNSALELWQVENEPFIHFDFGECKAFNAGLVEKESVFVKSLDSLHFVVVTDSGELGFWKKAKTSGDIFGTTLYRVVMSPSGRVHKYNWLPPAVYFWKAKLLGINYERFFVSELQAEPWLNSSDPRKISLDDQKKSLNEMQLQKNILYAQRVGASRVYLWGVEWWYWMKEHQKNPAYWNIVKDAIAKSKKEAQLNTKGQY